jgi:chaperonin GroES
MAENPIRPEVEEDLVVEEAANVEIKAPGEVVQEDVEMMEDGSALINPDPLTAAQGEFGVNLAEIVPEGELSTLANDLFGNFEEDKSTRGDWEKAYVDGLDLLGFKYTDRTQPFAGASSVTHPLLAETVTQFQAQAYKELLPADGPVRTQIVGNITPDVQEQANRVKDFMNYQIMDVMEEYDPDMDQLLFFLPLAGSAFKKVYYSDLKQRAVAEFIPAEDIVLPYLTTDIQSCERVCHVVTMMDNELRKKQASGFFRDIDIHPSLPTDSDIQSKYNQLEGTNEESLMDTYNLLEFHVDLDLVGFEDPKGVKVPYIVTIDKGSTKVLSIYRNWNPNDQLKKKVQYFVHYKFLPGLGFYGFGLIHMLGGLSRTATAALRQLIDAGTLSNLPAGFKARGLRIRDDDNPLQPGEFRDVDAPSGNLREGLVPLPYKGPDAVLFQLLGFVVQAGQKFAAIADQKIGEGSQANPVGTTMALIERGTKVMNAIHKRLHYSQKKEFKLLANVIQTYLPPEYPYMVKGGDRQIKVTDFDDRIDIIPVSDPNIFSMSQRVTLAQTQMQMAQAAPELHNMYEAYRRMYMALGVRDIDIILPQPPKPMPIDPARENSNSMQGQKLNAFPQQDHKAHIEAHRSFMSSFLVRQNPQVMSLLQAHISEHISLMATEEIEQLMSEELQQVQSMLQEAQQDPQRMQQAQRVAQEAELAKAKQIAARIAEITDKMLEEEEEMLEQRSQDPLVDLKQQEIDLREKDIQRKAMEEQQKLDFQDKKLGQNTDMQKEKIQSQEDIAQLRANVNLEKMDKTIKDKKTDLKETEIRQRRR